MFHVVLVAPEIPGNTGNAIRLAAATGVHLHLVEPLAFSMTDAHLRRAGLDYHDLATVTVHPDLADLWATVLPAAVYAFTSHAERSYTDVDYARGDVLLFGCEASGLAPEVLADPNVSDRLRIPMRPRRRSLNLANSVAIAVYEAWRQHDFDAGDGLWDDR